MSSLTAAQPKRLVTRAMLAGVLLGAAASGAYAQSDSGTDIPRPDPWYEGKEEVEVEEWREANVTLPPYPADSNLKPLHESRGSAYEFLLDTTSIELGTDLVVRYTAVVKSPAGSVNVFYEGCRCGRREYKTYAFGNPHKRVMRPQRNARWRMVKTSPLLSSLGFRPLLLNNYLCSEDNIPNTAREVLARLHHMPRSLSPRANE